MLSHLGLLAGRGRRRARNVLTRMEEMKGPLAILTECQQHGIRIKVGLEFMHLTLLVAGINIVVKCLFAWFTLWWVNFVS